MLQRKNTRRLAQLNTHIKQILLEKTYLGSLWIIAEISESKIDTRGNCYLELIDKDENSTRINAKARATIWSTTYRRINKSFEEATGKKIEVGLQVLLNVSVEFHEVFGYSLNVKEIDANYTLGDLERKRKEILKRLKEEGLLEKNNLLEMPEVIQRIAIVSSEKAAGYRDFREQLESNKFNYHFNLDLFSVFVQGEQTETSIVKALHQIGERNLQYDAIVILRGGGSKTDLGFFDSYDIAKSIANAKTPVITGIGHEQDDTVADQVAALKLKTPTAVAAWILERMRQFDIRLQNNKLELQRLVEQKLGKEKQAILQLSQSLAPVVLSKLHENERLLLRAQQNLVEFNHQAIGQNKSRLNAISNKVILLSQRSIRQNQLEIDEWKIKTKYLSTTVFHDNYRWLDTRFDRVCEGAIAKLNSEKHRLNLLEATNKLMDPATILKRGYSITRHNQKMITTIEAIEPGDTITTQVKEGTIESKVTKKYKDG